LDKESVTADSPFARAAWLRFMVALALVIGLLMSQSLWTGENRTLPLVPILPVNLTLPVVIGKILFYAMLALLAGAGLSTRPGRYTTAFLALTIVLCLLDYSRCQTWFYQYCFMLGLLSYWRNEEGVKTALDSCRVVVASAYLWGGIWKLNARFLGDTFSWFIQPLFPGIYGTMAQVLALPVPVMEICTSVALFFRRTRVPAIVFCFAMHILILICIGPTGRNINQIVWPWNIFMIIFVVLLFARTESVTPGQILKWRGASVHTLTLALFALAPILNIWNLWESNFSFFLYSGNQAAGFIYMLPETYQKLPPAIKKGCTRKDVDQHILILNAWAMSDLNVVVYPEPRVIRKIAKKLWQESGQPPDMVLVIEGRTLTNAVPPIERIPCSAL
jgi:hypothetical protein